MRNHKLNYIVAIQDDADIHEVIRFINKSFGGKKSPIKDNYMLVRCKEIKEPAKPEYIVKLLQLHGYIDAELDLDAVLNSIRSVKK